MFRISLILVNLGGDVFLFLFLRACSALSVLLCFCTPLLGPAGGHSEHSIAETLTRVPCGRSLEEGERFKKRKGKGKFHCSMEVKVRRGGRKGAMKENY